MRTQRTYITIIYIHEAIGFGEIKLIFNLL